MLIRDTFYYAIARGCPAVIGFFSIGLYTHLLSPEQYGEYVIAIAYAAIVDGFVFQWLRLSCFRFYPVYENKLNQFLAVILKVFLLLATSSMIIGGVFWILLPKSNISEMIPAIVLVMCSKAWFELNQTIANVSMSPKQYGIQGVSRAIFTVLVGGTMAYYGYGAFGLITGAIVGNVSYSFITRKSKWYDVLRSGSIKEKFDQAVARSLWHYGVPLTGTVLLSVVVSTTDRLMLSWFWGNREAGLFSASYDITKSVLSILMMIVTLGSKPHAVRAQELGDPDVFSKQLTEQFIFLLAVSLPAGAVLAASAPNVASVLLGKDFYESAIQLIPLITIIALLMGIRSYYFDLAFQLSGKTSGQLKVMFQATVLHVILNLLLVPVWAKHGAAIASMITFSYALLVSAFTGKKVLALPVPLSPMIKIIFSSLLIYSALSVIASYWHGYAGLIIQGVSALILYAGALYTFNLLGARKWVQYFVCNKQSA